MGELVLLIFEGLGKQPINGLTTFYFKISKNGKKGKKKVILIKGLINNPFGNYLEHSFTLRQVRAVH